MSLRFTSPFKCRRLSSIFKRNFPRIRQRNSSSNSTKNVVPSRWCTASLRSKRWSQIRDNRGILNQVRLSWTRRRRTEVALQTMAGISSNFFDLSVYAFIHNYSLSSERLVAIKITKFYVAKVVPSARKI
jgi:hypothetical protein